MKYSFSITLTSDSPENFGVDIVGLGHTAFAERYKAYNFNVEQGHAIRFNRMNTDANVIVENTGTEPFIWEDNVPRTRPNLKPG